MLIPNFVRQNMNDSTLVIGIVVHHLFSHLLNSPLSDDLQASLLSFGSRRMQPLAPHSF
jgi:hypothetical protein